MTDDERLADPAAAIASLPAGAAVVFRHYRATDRAQYGRRLRTLCRARRVLFLVAGDGRLASVLGADGLHLAQGLCAAIAGWRRRRPRWLITAAAHSAPALRRAKGADAAFVSPVFPTASHPGRPHLGPLRFAALTRQSPLPVVALGGVNGRTARLLNGIPLAGFAAISGLTAAKRKTHDLR